MGEKNKLYIIKKGKIYDKNHEQIYSIYQWTNIENGKVYFGRTTRDPRIRRNEHVSDAFSGKKHFHLHNSLVAYGIEKFKFEVIFQCKSFDVLKNTEMYFIALYNSNNKEYGYNLSAGGDGGGIPSEETRLKLSIAARGRILGPRTEKHNENHSKAMIAYYAENPSPILGIKRSQETKEKLRIVNLGKHDGDKNSFYGKKHTNELLLSQAAFNTQEDIDKLEKLKADGYTQKQLSEIFNVYEGTMTKIFRRRGIYAIFK